MFDFEALASRLVWRRESKPGDKVELPLQLAARPLCSDNGDTGQKNKTNLRAMPHMHLWSVVLRKACTIWLYLGEER